ncbi:cyanophycinase [Mahella australiensis]|uniref:Cyanophycinase n=1 Tax=Mahella australiensis (strain DSM 15567 / CIP 107919 / 50-1 BON) TaxID=697281 RepID=F3ZVI3_MAHA5|nr:cyanophycinase [Mahella australiensis]AEE96345.1 cyanophycinase [Mahella australiensis 50-1 BON]
MNNKVKGNLIIIGGAEDKYGDRRILKETVLLSGGNDSIILIITVATEYQKEVGNEYIDIFDQLGVKDVKVLNINDRQDANKQKYADAIYNASCVFFTGGDQLRISSILGGTLADEALLRAYEDGLLIAGTSAGASAMSQTMIVSGEDDDSPRKCTLKMAPGLGLLKGAVIDQHFAQRGRIGRLLSAIAQNPYMLGIGIDEDTAIHVMPNGCFRVIGSGAVTVLDGIHIDYTNVSELKPDQPLALTNITLHILPASYGFDMNIRQPLLTYDTKQEETSIAHL